MHFRFSGGDSCLPKIFFSPEAPVMELSHASTEEAASAHELEAVDRDGSRFIVRTSGSASALRACSPSYIEADMQIDHHSSASRPRPLRTALGAVTASPVQFIERLRDTGHCGNLYRASSQDLADHTRVLCCRCVRGTGSHQLAPTSVQPEPRGRATLCDSRKEGRLRAGCEGPRSLRVALTID